MILLADLENRKEPPQLIRILTGIGLTAPHRRDLRKLKVLGRRLDDIFTSSGISSHGSMLELYFIYKGYLEVGFDNHLYLTEKGMLRAGVLPEEVKRSPTIEQVTNSLARRVHGAQFSIEYSQSR